MEDADAEDGFSDDDDSADTNATQPRPPTPPSASAGGSREGAGCCGGALASLAGALVRVSGLGGLGQFCEKAPHGGRLLWMLPGLLQLCMILQCLLQALLLTLLGRDYLLVRSAGGAHGEHDTPDATGVWQGALLILATALPTLLQSFTVTPRALRNISLAHAAAHQDKAVLHTLETEFEQSGDYCAANQVSARGGGGRGGEAGKGGRARGCRGGGVRAMRRNAAVRPLPTEPAAVRPRACLAAADSGSRACGGLAAE